MLEEALSNKVTLSTRQLLQSAIAEQNRMPKIGDTITNSIDMELAYIPQGEFIMGSSEKKDEAPQHKVTISKGFYMGVCEVTQSQYKAIMGSNPSGHKKWLRGGGLPVECVSWDEATTFCNELGRRENRTYRLPTEAEWEYACRAGRSGTLFSFGNGSMISEYAWFKRNSDAETHATGKKKPNAFGLYDMHGNVNEWCSDWYDDHYPTTDDQIDPQGPTTGSFRVLRGGSYNCSSTECRSAWRIYSTPYEKTYSFGFRVVLEPK
jgi:formylglycine-generating enzyme required for sulfatase activity